MTELRAEGLRSRTLIFAACLACAFVVLLGRLAYLQILKHDEYSRLAENQHAKTVPLRPKRGPILDRGGQALAVSSRADTLYVTPSKVEDAPRLAARLAPILGEPARDLVRRLTVAKKFAPVRRRLTPDMARAVRDLKDPSLALVEDSLRLYPNRELAAQLVGFEGAEGKGLAGIEQAWDAHLAGVEGRAVVERDALGREVTGAPIVLKPSVAGQGIMLTIDATIQYLAEKEVDAAWRRTRAKSAMAVAMDPRTGEILAMAIRPTYNPNAFGGASDDDRRARAVTDPFEPGSTFKVIMAASALEEGVVRPTDRVYGENGAITVANATIHDWKKYGWLTFTEVLQNSSNVGSIKVGMMLGKERYYKYITAFGFGAPTNLGLPGESRGQLRPPGQWSGLSLATMSIGQEISVTAVQMVAAFSAVANGGRLMQPQIIRAVLDAQGREIRSFEPIAVRQVISPETARTLTEMMVNVVRNGTGHNAAIPGYDVAGKTGTAQKMDPGHPALLARPRRALVRGLRARRRSAPGHDRAARRAEEREVGERGGGAHLRRDRPRGPALSQRGPARLEPGADRAGASSPAPPRSARGAAAGAEGPALDAVALPAGAADAAPAARLSQTESCRDSAASRSGRRWRPWPRTACDSRSPAAAW